MRPSWLFITMSIVVLVHLLLMCGSSYGARVPNFTKNMKKQVLIHKTNIIDEGEKEQTLLTRQDNKRSRTTTDIPINYEDTVAMTEMDYSPAKRKPPIHN